MEQTHNLRINELTLDPVR